MTKHSKHGLTGRPSNNPKGRRSELTNPVKVEVWLEATERDAIKALVDGRGVSKWVREAIREKLEREAP